MKKRSTSINLSVSTALGILGTKLVRRHTLKEAFRGLRISLFRFLGSEGGTHPYRDALTLPA
jgi:hypothetical protein